MSAFKANLGQHTDFTEEMTFGLEALDGVIVQNNPVNRIDPYGLWSFTDMPSFSEAFPNSNYIAPMADIATGGIELGVGVAFGAAGAIGLAAGPEFWPLAAPALGTAVAAGWDGQGRVRTGIERIGNSDPCNSTNPSNSVTPTNTSNSPAGGGFVLYPNKPNTNTMQSVYGK